MNIPHLQLVKSYKRPTSVFFIFSLTHDNPDPFVSAGKHRFRIKTMVSPDGNVTEDPSLGIIEEFGDITEHSYIQFVYKVDLNNPLFKEMGLYTLYAGQIIEGKRWGNLVKLSVEKK